MKTYGTMSELVKDLKRAMESADLAVTPEQESIKAGMYAIRFTTEGYIVWSEIIDHMAHWKEKLGVMNAHDAFRKGGEEMEDEYKYEANLYLEPHMKHYRFSRTYSVLCPDGELGDVHVSTLTRVPSSIFEAAKTLKWRVSLGLLWGMMETDRSVQQVVKLVGVVRDAEGGTISAADVASKIGHEDVKAVKEVLDALVRERVLRRVTGRNDGSEDLDLYSILK
jgi:hypothetical protein